MTKPLGVTPKFFWLRDRMADVSAAINRYINGGEDVPDEWVDELHWLTVQIAAAKRERDARDKARSTNK